MNKSIEPPKRSVKFKENQKDLPSCNFKKTKKKSSHIPEAKLKTPSLP